MRAGVIDLLESSRRHEALVSARVDRREQAAVLADALYRLLRPGGRLVMYGLSQASTERGRSISRTLRALVRMPTATIPFERAGKAHTFIAERRNVGKVLLVP